jgi:hypothetical protein
MPRAYTQLFARKMLSVFMMALLVLLTSMNFFVYGQSDPGSTGNLVENSMPAEADNAQANDNSPAGPDEKSPGNPFSFSEEYLHDEEETTSVFIDALIHQLLIECSKVHPAHYELDTPPPDRLS